jgi:hypothetical protein
MVEPAPAPEVPHRLLATDEKALPVHSVDRMKRLASSVTWSRARSWRVSSSTSESCSTGCEAIDGGAVWVIQRGEDSRFPFKPNYVFSASDERLRKDLDGDLAIELGVSRPVDLSHSASPEGGDHLVGPEAPALGQPHECGLILVGTDSERRSCCPGRMRATSGRRLAI